ncbi:NAD(P)-dependent oxidoreductase [Pseudomonas citronellolis]|uniref:NAD(P)-dependent oxidoreductase n=1 Tax=Pseudomonas citronellolis TaxID=53408 RepID=UPI000778C1E0|nr:NAD(P)-dependent oxidoreductase [Pseudomonas citronellolis]AMO76086.1 NAD dependent epimerase/dehydratase family protein [Pseudomonas citronellolis]
MKIVIFGALGRAGRHIVQEALKRGHDVIGVSRQPTTQREESIPRLQLVRGDATQTETVAQLVAGADAVVNSISPRPSAGGPACSLEDAARALIQGLRTAGVKRLLVVGGAGSLEVAPGIPLKSMPDFPTEYLPEATAQGKALELYRNEAVDLDWTYLSPAIIFDGDKRTGHYRITGDSLLTDADGISTISFADYAVATLDELERPQHLKQRFGVAY